MLSNSTTKASEQKKIEKCTQCGCNTHLKSKDGAPQCRSCASIGRTCLRCGKELPKASKIVDGGAVCSPCATYYREPKACPVCGQFSLRLSKDSKSGYGDLQICEYCQRKKNVTCACCGKNRSPAGANDEGKAICKSCMERGDKPFICKSCGMEGKPHSKTECQTCYWIKRAESRFKDSVALLSHEWVRLAFEQFFNDLITRQNPHAVATNRIEKYFLFFAKLDASFSDPKKITAKVLLDAFGAEGLRRHAVPYGFLVKAKLINEITQESIQEANEQRKQVQIINNSKGEWYSDLLHRFYIYQEKIQERYADRGWKGKRRRFVPRTITANLNAATVLFTYLSEQRNVKSLQQISKDEIEPFYADKPGYKVAVSSLLRYMDKKEKLFGQVSRKKSVETDMPATRSLPEGIFLSRNQYQELLRKWLNPDDKSIKESLCCALMLIYAQSATDLVKLRLDDISYHQNGLYKILFGQTEITLDPRVSALLNRYLEQRKALATMEDIENNDFLFTGRTYGGHITEAALTYYLKKHNVSAKQLFSTALYNAYMGGLRHPKVLVKAFGITDHTAIKYLNIIDPQLIQEINSKVANA